MSFLPLICVIGLFYQPSLSYAYMAVTFVFIISLHIITSLRPNTSSLITLSNEQKSIYESFAFTLKHPELGYYFSQNLQCIQWSSFIAVPWLIYNSIWIPAIYLIIVYCFNRDLPFRLYPYHTFFMSSNDNDDKFMATDKLEFALNFKSIYQQLNPTRKDGDIHINYLKKTIENLKK